MDGTLSALQGNTSVMKHLEGIQEEDLEREATLTKQRLKEAGFDKSENESSMMRMHSKEGLKEEDSSRMNILSRDSSKT